MTEETSHLLRVTAIAIIVFVVGLIALRIAR
jgi:hypothetical protein